MFRYVHYSATSTRADGTDGTELHRAELRDDIRQDIATFLQLQALTDEVDRLLVRQATTPPTHVAGFLEAIREHVGLIRRFDDDLTAHRRPGASRSDAAVRAQVVLTDALACQSQGEASPPMTHAVQERLAGHLAETGALLDQLPSVVLEKLQDNGFEAEGCRLYRLTDVDLHIRPDTVLQAIDIATRLRYCGYHMDDPALQGTLDQLETIRSKRSDFINDPGALVPLSDTLQRLYQNLCEAYRHRHPDAVLNAPAPAPALDRTGRSGHIEAAIQALQRREAEMLAYTANATASPRR